jgi:hypothetical protein
MCALNILSSQSAERLRPAAAGRGSIQLIARLARKPPHIQALAAISNGANSEMATSRLMGKSDGGWKRAGTCF